jgi:hypothetical protein
VSVMSDGIEGWRSSGKAVEHPTLDSSKNS